MLNLLSLAISCCGTSKREYIMVQQRALKYLHAPNIQVVSKAPFLSHQANLLFILYTILFSLTRRQVWKVPPENTVFPPNNRFNTQALPQQHCQALKSIRHTCSLPDHLSYYCKMKKNKTSLEFMYSLMHSGPLNP